MTALKDLEPFLAYVDEWGASLTPLSLSEVASDPARTAICSVDLTRGFCRQGNLSSPRVGALVVPIVDLFQRAYDHGVRDFVLLQDTHSEQAEEFKAFPPHCVRGTEEAQTVAELAGLPFAEDFVLFQKNSLDSAVGTGLDEWLRERPQLQTFVVVGDCTDFCVYSLALHLKVLHTAKDRWARVIVPANAVDTYDIPVELARQTGARPHPGDFFHRVFLYHLALCGVEVVSGIQ